MNITIQTLFALLATVLYIGELEGQISANQLKKPRAEEGGWAQEKKSAEKAQRRRAGRGADGRKCPKSPARGSGAGCRSGKEPKKPRAGERGGAQKRKEAEKVPFPLFCCICWEKYAIIERVGNHSKQCKEFRSYKYGIMQI